VTTTAKEIIDGFIWLFTIVLLAFLTQIFLASWVWTVVILLPMAIIFQGLLRSSRIAGFIIAKRSWMVFCVSFLLICSGLIIIIVRLFDYDILLLSSLEQNRIVGNINRTASIIGFIVIGVILGALFRQAVGRAIYGTLLHRLTVGHRVSCIAIWTATVIIFPYPYHPEAIPYYFCGVAIGILIHKAFHLWLERKVQGYRRICNIYAAWPSGAQGTHEEYQALKLLKKLRHTRLRKRLNDWKSEGRNVFTTKLTLISASLFRIEGDYERSNAEIDSACDPESIKTMEDIHLLLLKTINLRDCNKDVEAIQLINILRLSQIGRTCPLVHATYSLLQSETVLNDLQGFTPSIKPLLSSYRSMLHRNNLVLVRQSISRANSTGRMKEFLSRFLDYCVPVSTTLMLDVLGYALLAANHISEAKVLFQECITVDPTYTSAYLHLGDYFTIRACSISEPSLKARNAWHASLCYWTAKYSEKVNSSRVSTISSHRLMA